MGCGPSSNKESKKGDKTASSPAPAPKKTSEAKKKQCAEIVDKLDTDGNGRMSATELRILVKHLYPNFINTPADKIDLSHPKIQALDGKSKAELISHLDLTCDETWVSVFHQFLGCAKDTKVDYGECQPGVYKVVWEGGVRYRRSPSYQDIADDEQLALPETEFEIVHFEQGTNMKLWYGYIHWARYWLPITFQDGRAMLERIDDVGTSKQLDQLAEDLFTEIDSDDSGQASWEEITSFLEGAKIAYDAASLKKDFEAADADQNGELNKEEFKACYQCESISNVFCIPTKDRQDIPHPPGVMQKLLEITMDKRKQAAAKSGKQVA